MTPAGPPTAPVEVPALVRAVASHVDDAVWANQIGGVTFVAGDRYLKWNPRDSGVDLAAERDRLHWARAVGHAVPEVLDFATDAEGQVLVTRAMTGTSAALPPHLDDPERAVRAIAEGLRALHDRVPAAACPFPVPWIPPGAPPLDAGPVVVHGDACAPNTLVDRDGGFAGHVDLGDLGVGDRWADLAIASLSLSWNYGDGWEPLFFATYGVEPDPERIRWFRAAWDEFS